DVTVDGPEVVAARRTHERRGVDEGAAAEGPAPRLVNYRLILGVDQGLCRSSLRVTVPRLAAPVPEVAVPVGQPEVVRALLAHRPAPVLAIALKMRVAWQQVQCGSVMSALPRARPDGVFQFRLAGQTVARPTQVVRVRPHPPRYCPGVAPLRLRD